MDIENMFKKSKLSAKNQSYTENTSMAKPPGFSKTAAMASRVKVKIFTFSFSYSSRLHLGQSKNGPLTVLIQCLKFVSLNTFNFSSSAT